jgi:O-antigen/teichoic acid export membrane protein
MKVIIIWILVSHDYKSKDAILYSWLISQITIIYTLSINLKRNKIFISEALEVIKLDNKDVIKQSYPISFGALVNLFQLQGYRLIIVPLGSAEIVGIYSTLESIGKAGMNAVAAIYAQIFTPNIYKTDGKFTNTYVKNALLLAGFVLIFFYMIDEYIVLFLTNYEFLKYKSLIMFGVLIEAANFIIGAYAIKLTLLRKNRLTLLGLFNNKNFNK